MHQDTANCDRSINLKLNSLNPAGHPSGAVALGMRRIAISIVIDAVARAFAVAPQALKSRRRGVAKIALARQVAMYLTHVACGATLKEAGNAFGRDRTTVAYACKRVEDLREEAMFDWRVECIERSIKLHLTMQANWEVAS